MKKLAKVLMGAALPLLLIGAILAGVGWAMGAETVVTVRLRGRPIQVGVTGIHGTYASAEYADSSVRSDQDLTAFQNVDIDIDLGDVVFLTADTYGVDLVWYGSSYELHYSNENGVLRVWSTSTPSVGVNLSGNYGGTVTVYLPEDARFQDVSVRTSLGDADLSGFQTETLTVEAGLGDVTVYAAGTKSGTFDLSLGDLDLSSFSAETLELDLDLGGLTAYGLSTEKSLTVDSSMGGVDLQGDLLGTVDITADMGDVYLSLGLPQRDYGYDLKTSMGDVTVDGQDFDEHATRQGGSHFITVHDSMGDVDVYFA